MQADLEPPRVYSVVKKMDIRHLIVIPVLCALLFGCIGPPTGSLVFTLLPMIAHGAKDNPIGMIVLGAFFSYIFGTLPALMTGFLSGYLIRANKVLFCISSSAIGAFNSFLFFKLTTGRYSYDYDFWTGFYRMAAPGLLGGLSSGLLAFIAYKKWLARDN